MADFISRVSGVRSGGVSIHLDASKVEKKLRDLKARDFLMKIAQAVYTSAMNQFVPKIQDTIKKNGSVFTGRLFQSVGAQIVPMEGAKIRIDVGTIGVDYSAAVEKGLKPGTVQDEQKLIAYARLKLGMSPKRAIVVGRILKRHIEAKGTKPHPFLVPSIKAQKDVFEADVEARFKVLVEEAGR